MFLNKYPYTDFHELNLDWVIKTVKELTEQWLLVRDEFTDLKTFVENYFENLDVQQEINNKLDEMAEDNTLSTLISPFVTTELPGVVDDQIDGVVADQIGGTVADQIGAVVADQIPGPAAAAASAWLVNNITNPSNPPLDKSLLVNTSAANSYIAGATIYPITSASLTGTPCKIENLGLGHFTSLNDHTILNTSPIMQCVKITRPDDANDWVLNAPNKYMLGYYYDANDTYIGAGASWEHTINLHNEVDHVYLYMSDTSNGDEVSTEIFGDLVSYATKYVKQNELNYPSYLHTTYDESGYYPASDYIPFTDDMDYISLTISGGNLFTVYGYDSSKVLIGEITPTGQFVDEALVNDHIYKYIKISNVCDANLDPPGSGYQSTISIETRYVNTNNHYLSQDGNSTYRRIYFTVKNDNNDDIDCVLKLPNTYKRTGTPTKLLMICHGSGNTINALTDSCWNNYSNTLRMFDYFISNGYAIFDVNGYSMAAGGQEIWGSNKGVNIYKKAYQYIVDHYNVEKDFSIYGFSMGGLTALNLVNNNFPNIKCVAISAPVVSVYDEAWVDEVTSKDAIRDAYDFTGLTYEPDKVVSCDPFVSLLTISGDEYFTKTIPPIKMWHGDADSSVPYTYTQRLYNAMQKSNIYSEFTLVAGGDHDICYGDDASLYADYLGWLEKFNN